MGKHVITLLLFVVAIAFYLLGLALPATFLVGLGLVAELAFWFRLFRRQ